MRIRLVPHSGLGWPLPCASEMVDKTPSLRQVDCGVMSYLSMTDTGLGLFDPSTADKGNELAVKYQSGEPFPHIVIDDFLPSAALEACLEAFPQAPDPKSRAFDAPSERKKTQYNPDFLPSHLRSMFYSFNSRPFIGFLENLTGISGLIPDPYFLGGGFHELKTGGHLSVHADFNKHDQLSLERRINILIYLNKNWTDADGGQLELWDDDMTRCVQSVVPIFNRAVVFSTTSNSMHGNPNPIAEPNGRSRRSIALYYYTATWADQKGHSTLFRARPGDDPQLPKSGLRKRTRAEHLVRDLLPPAALRGMEKARAALLSKRR